MKFSPARQIEIAVCIAILVSSLGPRVSAKAAEPVRPNVIVIVADDQGYGDLGFQGGRDIPTPHIDSLAANGVRCTNGYVSGPYCSPTRAGLLTGRYQQRFGHEFNPGPAKDAGDDVGLSLKEVTLADRLKGAGYATGMVGKWHLGYAAKFHPLQRGFTEYFGFLGGAHSYLDFQEDKFNPILRGTEPVDEKAYLTDTFGREAVAYIDRHQREPFFLYLTFNAVHTPMQATEKYLERFSQISDERRRTYAAMTAAMDDAIGLVLGKLRQTNIEQNTLIFYISDNGGPPVNGSNNHPLRGYKAQTLEGGVRVPFVVQWKGRLPAGKTYEAPVIQLDIHPTVLAAAGVTLPSDAKIDGVNLLPYLAGQDRKEPHDALYWRFGAQMAIRQGNWKLVKHAGGEAQELYDLAADIGESKDLAAKELAKVKELNAKWDAWNSELVAPAWGPAAKKNANAKKANAKKKKAAA
jgi:arylsulfatase A-like enzyme